MRVIYFIYYNILNKKLRTMIAYNPFTQRNFATSNVSSYSHDRRYFPNMPSNVTRPGFLIPTQQSFPKVTSDMRSPYFKLSTKEQPRTRNKYVQNPFHKSHLLEDSDYLASSGRLYTSDVAGYSSRYGGFLSQSAVTPVVTDSSYKPYPSAYGKYEEYAYTPRELPRQDSKDKYKNDGLNKKNSLSSQNLGGLNKKSSSGIKSPYDSYDNRPIISQAGSKYQTQQSGGLERKRSSKNSNPQQNAWDSDQKQGLLKKNSSNQFKNQRMESNESAIRKFDNISERPSYEEDDPLNYNYPSFNMKGKIKKADTQQAQSPTWPGTYLPFNEERVYDGSTFSKSNENRGVQAVNPRMPDAPKTITYNGKMFYLVNMYDEL